MHTQHNNTARIARQVGDSLGDLLFFPLVFFLLVVCPLRDFICFWVVDCLGQALPPCGVERSCDTLPRARLGGGGPGLLCGCFWQVIFTNRGDASGDFRGVESWCGV